MRHRLSLLILSAAAATGCASTRHDAVASAPVGAAPMPATRVVALDGSSTDLIAVLHGRPAIITLWAPWCEGCLAEIDALKRLDAQTAVRGDGVVVGVAVGEPRQAVADFARSRGLAYARWVDEDFHLADALGERRVPATLVVGRDGNIVYRGGALDQNGLAAFRGALGAGVEHGAAASGAREEAAEARGGDLR